MARRIARAPRRSRGTSRRRAPTDDRSEFVNPNDPEWRKNVVTMYQDAQVFIDGKYRVGVTITPTRGIQAAAETVSGVARVGARIEVRQDGNSWFFIRTEDGVVPEARGGMREAPRRGVPADETAARELVMYIENESDLSPDGPRGQGRDVLLNALRKYRNGTYDPTLAVKLFGYLVESGAKRYAKEFGSSEREWSTMFPPATRQEAARQLEASFRSSAEQGEYDRIDTKRGAREPQGAREPSGQRTREPGRRVRAPRDRDRPISMTYGQLPLFEEFEQDIRRPDPDNKGRPYWPDFTLYPMELVGAREIELAERFGLDEFEAERSRTGRNSRVRGFQGDQQAIYDFLGYLIEQLNDGDDEAGDLASSIMTTLGYEWI